ncbi:hypothetical protein AADR41_30145 [Streptomyces sp. CLV115]|uniref:hypothetical protein n=1 Tax=Streptomyces sp. CLV115 TaxID=3138502 RepID=UPI00313BFD17
MFTSPDAALGKGWKSFSDTSVTGTGDTAGFHILRADESSSFAYQQVADLRESALGDIGPWTGYVCTTGSGRYAAAVYAPSLITNRPAMMAKDAFAAVVDLTTGKVTKPVTGVELAYYSPGCGATDTVTFTRSGVGDDGRGDTTVYDVAAATGTVVCATVHGQFTNPLPTADGNDLGGLGGKLVKVSEGGRTTTLTPLSGRLFGLAPSQGGAVDLATVQGGKDAVTRWDGTRLTPLGTAPLRSLALFRQAHGDLVAGASESEVPMIERVYGPLTPCVRRQPNSHRDREHL